MKRFSLALLLLLLFTPGVPAQAPASDSGRAVRVHLTLHLAPAFGAHYDEEATVYGAQLEITAASPVALLLEANRWDSPPHGCVGVGYCSPFLDRSLEAGLNLRSTAGTWVEPYAGAGLGVLVWEGRSGALATTRIGADVRLAGRVSLRAEASQRRVISGPLHYGERLRYNLIGVGLRLSMPALR